ncbi:NRAMP family divalent metal transporter [Sphingomonas canadensis]|uniref:NRAMP family divalent metal transporter n=1 Tax=Sphingomonas canadensis TaxID=1219257 RepID=A0ABW3H7G2_9SPHN|nr:divalent metal cation transporter [Sphingomonas canadensis]MCW3837321.1 divalent metal cation transporter [Sphingomonas canadensis]
MGLSRLIGAGLITGAADDDPSGIVTYSQAGAQFGYQLNWTMLATLPLLAAVQQIAARVGRVTGRGVVANLRDRVPRSILLAIVLLLAVANAINLGADLGAMGEVAAMVAGGAPHPYVLAFGAFCAIAQIFVSYGRYVRLLRWLTLSLFAYVGTALAVAIPWGEVLKRTVVPAFGTTPQYLLAVVAILGTTIAPYLIFWQAAEEVEDLELAGEAPLIDGTWPASLELRRIRFDTWLGIGFSNIVGLFIIIATAATLHVAGVTDIASAEQAAQALRPIAGAFAAGAFAAGIIGTGLLAVPVLAGSAAYAVGEAFGRPVGLGRRPGEARSFYAIIALSTLIGVGLHFTPIPPMRALFLSAVINGVIVIPILVALLVIAADRRVMGSYRVEGAMLWLGWITAAAMAAAGIAAALVAIA